MEKEGYVYILSNESDSVFYIGVTSDIKRRLYEHRHHIVEGFTDKYNVTKVLLVENTPLVFDAIEREKQLKRWSRIKKINLIKLSNPEMRDLYEDIMRS